MADEPAMLSESINAFFIRCGLDPRARLDCDAFLNEHFPARSIMPTHTQGYCSYTVSVGDNIVQFRPSKYKLNLDISNAAMEVYKIYAPATASLGVLEPHKLHIYTMSKLQGMSYKDFALQHQSASPSIRKTLAADLATFLALAWHNHPTVPLPPGIIATSILSRLSHLKTELPPRFRPAVSNVISQYPLIESLPTALAHGDIVPSNILLSPSTGHLFGLVDWAEAEMLPFGICLYGLEEILGYINPDRTFVYHANAEDARAAFWDTFLKEIPELKDERTMRAVMLARDLGVLLWHGFAFDDGAINRVVQEEQDWIEVCYLDALLLGPPRTN